MGRIVEEFARGHEVIVPGLWTKVRSRDMGLITRLTRRSCSLRGCRTGPFASSVNYSLSTISIAAFVDSLGMLAGISC